MALDFHIAQTEDEAAYLPSALAFEMLAHKSFFMHPNVNETETPLLWRMVDYFGDAHYERHDVYIAVNELEQLPCLPNYPESHKQSKILLTLFQQAKEQNTNVWLFAD